MKVCEQKTIDIIRSVYEKNFVPPYRPILYLTMFLITGWINVFSITLFVFNYFSFFKIEELESKLFKYS